MQITGYHTMLLPVLRTPGRQPKKATNPIDPLCIIAVAVDFFGFSYDALRGSSKKRDVTFVRQLAMEAIRRKCVDLSLREIGELFNRDHSTVIHAKDCIQDFLDTDYRTDDILFLLTHPF